LAAAWALPRACGLASSVRQRRSFPRCPLSLRASLPPPPSARPKASVPLPALLPVPRAALLPVPAPLLGLGPGSVPLPGSVLVPGSGPRSEPVPAQLSRSLSVPLPAPLALPRRRSTPAGSLPRETASPPQPGPPTPRPNIAGRVRAAAGSCPARALPAHESRRRRRHIPPGSRRSPAGWMISVDAADCRRALQNPPNNKQPEGLPDN
jgi:hypothetical protein